MMICKKCGNEVKEGEKFCSECGYKINNEEIVNKDQVTVTNKDKKGKPKKYGDK